MLSDNAFNMSPLRGYSEVDFVRTAEEMVACVSAFSDNSTILINKNFFNLDNALPKWKKLLNI